MRAMLIAVAAGALLGAAGLFAAASFTAVQAPAPPADPNRIWADRFPNVELQTHDGRTVRFYDDLIAGKTVALNFIYVECTSF